jgi:putative hydrolase of the HAD superfamily
MTQIKAVFFDFGGVLLQFMDGVDHKSLEERLGLEPRTFMRFLYRDSRYMDYQQGACTEKEWRDSIRSAAIALLGEEIASAAIAAYEEAERPLNPHMMSLVARLRENGYSTGIISNTIPGLMDRLKAERPEMLPLFDVFVGSGDLCIAKPDPGIFHHALGEMGVDAEQSVFADDVKQYAEAARSLGMHGFHFTGYDQFAADLRSIGVNH